MDETKKWGEFAKFEKKYKLFDYQDDNGIFVWDIIRHQIYIEYTWGLSKKNNDESLSYRIKRLFLSLFSLIKIVVGNKEKAKYLFLINSREEIKPNIFYDRNFYDIVATLQKDKIFIIENFYQPGIKYYLKKSYLQPSYFLNFIFKFFLKKGKYHDLINLINQELNLEWHNEQIIIAVNAFRVENFFYKWLLKRKQIKKIFTFFIPKGIICAARELGIETIEMQHGIIDSEHISYNYPIEYHYNHKLYIPDIFLTFSPFWKKNIYYPVDKILSIGNSSLNNLYDYTIGGTNRQNVIFISSIAFGECITPLTIDFAVRNQKIKIYFKLHFDQRVEFNYYKNKFIDYPNIEVINSNKSVHTLFPKSMFVVAIQSTVVYEALQAGKIVFLYKRMTYHRHSALFEHPNMYLIDNASEINLSDVYPQKSKEAFFDKFNKNILSDIL